VKWRKLGVIFKPTEHRLLGAVREFAQSPQALLMEDRVRIYFSTRERDAVGKYLSHVAYADLSNDFQRVLDVSTSTVIPLGGLGSFDEHGIFPVHICRDADRLLAYTTGWNRKVSVSADAAIGLAVSQDGGRTFVKVGTGPVLAASLHEPFLIGDAFVQRHGPLLHMWYIFGQRWIREREDSTPDRVYKIAHATSVDGIEWNRDGRQIVPDQLGVDECQALPTVFELDGVHHMMFCFRQAHGFRDDKNSGYRIGHAWSTDLRTWQRDDDRVGIALSSDGWDSKMQCYPNVFKRGGDIFLLYNGDAFGRFGFGLAVLEAA
jgi:hypothetical protein